VRTAAVHAVLYTLFGIGKIASAFRPQEIEGAVAEQTVEVIFLYAAVTGEVFTFFVLKKLIILRHGNIL